VLRVERLGRLEKRRNDGHKTDDASKPFVRWATVDLEKPDIVEKRSPLLRRGERAT
jgi:hypothetical protein